jgi:hypothetical protein
MDDRNDSQNQAGGHAPPPSPSQGGSQNQGGIPSPGGRVADRAELESDPSPAEDDIPDRG